MTLIWLKFISTFIKLINKQKIKIKLILFLCLFLSVINKFIRVAYRVTLNL